MRGLLFVRKGFTSPQQVSQTVISASFRPYPRLPVRQGWVSEPCLPGAVDETRDLSPHLQGVLGETRYHGVTQQGHSPPASRGSRGHRAGRSLPSGSPSSPHLTDPACLGLSTSRWEGRRRVLREMLHPQRNPLQRLLGNVSCMCVHRERHMSRPHLLVEDSRPSLESAVNGFYKQLLTEKRLSSKQCTFLKELVHFPMRMVLFNVSPLKTRICVSVGKCPHGLGENRAGGVGGGAEGLAQGMPTGPPGGCPRARQGDAHGPARRWCSASGCLKDR